MYLGDNLLKQGARPLIDVFNSNASDCVIGVAKVKDPSRYGIVQFEDQQRVTRLVEKPKEYVSNWALIGVYIFNDKIFEAVKRLKPSWRGELEITEGIQLLLDEGARIDVQFVQGWWKDTGRPEDLLEANQLILHDLEPYNKGKVEEGATVMGRVGVERGTIVRSGSSIRGPAVLGESCEIGPKAYIGPYTSIGSHVTIRNGEVENSIIMDGTTIDCGKRIVDSIVGKDTRIVDVDRNIPRGHRLILGDATYASL